MAVWRKIWQDSIKVGKETLLKNDQKGKLFEGLKQKYPNDAMVIFEEAITLRSAPSKSLILDFILFAIYFNISSSISIP